MHWNLSFINGIHGIVVCRKEDVSNMFLVNGAKRLDQSAALRYRVHLLKTLYISYVVALMDFIVEHCKMPFVGIDNQLQVCRSIFWRSRTESIIVFRCFLVLTVGVSAQLIFIRKYKRFLLQRYETVSNRAWSIVITLLQIILQCFLSSEEQFPSPHL